MSVKGINTLIRLKKQEIDKFRRALMGLEDKKQQLLDQHAKHAQELQNEFTQAKNMPDMGGFFGDFAGRIKKQQQELMRQAAELDLAMAKIRDQMADLFSDMKKFEIVRDQRLAKAKEAREKRESDQLDEVALMADARKRVKNPD